MRYAVHVTTQEEQDYVSMKLNNEIYDNRWNYITNDNDIFDEYKYVIANGYEIITFEEFKSRYEPKLKIGDTFEYNGFICEVKEKIEEKLWFVLKNKYTKSITYRYAKEKEYDYFNNDEDYECIKITNKEFIKQLEENAR